MAHEYKVVRLRVGPETEATLNALGNCNWRMVGMSDGFAVFRRRLRGRMPSVSPNFGQSEIEKSDGQRKTTDD